MKYMGIIHLTPQPKKRRNTMRDKICIALDVPNSEAIGLIEKLAGKIGWCKIGPALLTTEDGLRLAAFAKSYGFKTFLDFKFHDVPSVVAKGIINLKGIADLVTVHLSGGDKMIREAVAAAAGELLVIGITVLTSLDGADLEDMNINVGTQAQVARLAEIGSVAGIDGCVSSVNELPMLKKAYPDAFLVTPGLKMGKGTQEDQKRSSNPRWAYEQGSNLMVMGRDIYQASDPVKQVEDIEKWCLGS